MTSSGAGATVGTAVGPGAGDASGVAWGKDDNANTVMVDVARSLSDEEIQALSSYIEGLHAAAEVAAQ